MRDGFFKRPRIGISLATVPGEQARSLVGHESAVMVQGVIRRSPAARGGLKEGDLILKINNEPVYTAREVQRAVLRHPENDPIKITVRRAGKEIELSIAGRMTEPPLLRQR